MPHLEYRELNAEYKCDAAHRVHEDDVLDDELSMMSDFVTSHLHVLSSSMQPTALKCAGSLSD